MHPIIPPSFHAKRFLLALGLGILSVPSLDALSLPWEKSVEATDLVPCFQSYAYRGPTPTPSANVDNSTTGTWQARIHCVVLQMEQESSGELDTGAAFAMVDKLLKPQTPEERLRSSERTQYFDADDRWLVRVSVLFPQTLANGSLSLSVQVPLGRTERDGHVESLVPVPTAGDALGGSLSAGAVVPFRVQLPPGDARQFGANVLIPEEQGYAIFSDIDDTIKITQVLHYPTMFANAFLREYQPIAGMPELYAALQQTLSTEGHAPMNLYVSGSPWQLLQPLQPFLDQYFPAGELLLNRFDVHGLSVLELPAVEKYKSEKFEYLHRLHPAKRWYLIGDAGQQDPEIYAGIYERWGSDVIACIWIKTVHGTDPEKEVKLNAPERFQTTFAKVPQERWNVIEDPASVKSLPAGQCRQ